MALKVNKTQEASTTDLVTMESLLPVSASDLVNVTSPDSRLPTLKLVNPIEIDGTNFRPEHSYAFGLLAGDNFQPLPANVILTVLAARDSTRQLQIEIDGQKIASNPSDPAHKTLKKSYTRLYKAIGKYANSDAAYAESLKDATYQRGIDYLVAIIMPDGGVCIADLGAYKTQSSYWHKPLGQANILNKLGAKILIDNHACNIVSAKNDPSHKYVGPQKFDQFKIEELSKEQLKAVQAAMTSAKSDMESWFQR